jgi:hypothetical protein
MPLDFDKQSLSYSQKPKKKSEPSQESTDMTQQQPPDNQAPETSNAS